jgi:hypothetical protein
MEKWINIGGNRSIVTRYTTDTLHKGFCLRFSCFGWNFSAIVGVVVVVVAVAAAVDAVAV